MALPTDTLTAIADVSIAFAPPPIAALPDRDLMDALGDLGEIKRRADAVAAIVSAELKRRSRPELGHQGLAQGLGLRTGEKLVQRLTGVTAGEAHQLVRVGEITAPVTVDSPPDLPSWLGAVGSAVRAGDLGLAAADAIRSGLGSPREGVPAEALARAAADLVLLASTLTVEQLAVHARQTRDALDEAGIADRAARLRERRFLRLSPQSDGMTRVSGLLDPESAAIVTAAYDGATSPRRGGPRFVDAEALERAEQLQADERTVDQIAADAFVELIRLGAGVDPGKILPVRRPEVVVRVTMTDLDRRAGSGSFDGQTSPVGIPAVERQICEAGIVPVLFDDNNRIVNIGVKQRLFTQRQRIALAERDRGCRFEGCERPPSWCEAHHIQHWEHGGATSIDNGILLCRHHHLLVHDHGWTIRRDPSPGDTRSGTRRGNGWIIEPPPGVTASSLTRFARETIRA
jgi:hypothetical protein